MVQYLSLNTRKVSGLFPVVVSELWVLKLISFLNPFLFKVRGRGLVSVSHVLQFSQHHFV